jgi:hypothetical protein
LKALRHKGSEENMKLTLNQKVGGSIPSWRTIKNPRGIRLPGVFLVSGCEQKEVETGSKRL